MSARIDLDRVEAVINRPHIIDLREDGWTIMHPLACHPDLFACLVNQAALAQLDGPPDEIPFGRYFCELDEWARLAIGGEADDAEGVDWKALVAEARAAREAQQEASGIITDLLDWMDRKQGGDPSLHPEAYFRSTEWARRFLDDQITALAADDKATAEPTP